MGAVISSIIAWRVPMPLAWIPFALFLVTSAALLVLAARPVVEIYDTHLQIGTRAISWSDIRRVDQTNWRAPLVVDIELPAESGGGLRLIYPGDMDACAALLRCLRRYSREALLDGVPYRQYWGEPSPLDQRALPPPRYPLLRPEDEEEVERMFQRLKAMGHIDQQGGD
jgi:hypothetical protein